MNCHICTQPATGQCQICSKFYCADHGDRVCQPCRERRSADQGGPREALVRLLRHGPSGAGRPTPPNLWHGIPKLVISVIQTAKHSETEVTLVSLDVYEEGFVANFSLHGVGTGSAAPEPFLVQAPVFQAKAIDDQGNEYEASDRGGGGGDGHWRQAQHFTPALVASARLIHVSVGEILWKGLGQGVSSGVEPGPWEFHVSLE